MNKKPCLKLAFQDIDGCLNPVDGEDFLPGGLGTLSKTQIEMLARIGKAMDQSSLDEIVINTGRNYEDSEFIIKALHSKKIHFALLEHSAYAWDIQANSRIDLEKIAHEQQEFDMAKRYAFLPQVARLIPWYREHGMNKLAQQGIHVENCLNKEANLSIAIPDEMEGEQLLAALKRELETHFSAAFCSQLHYCHSNFFVDILGSILKSDGAKLLCQALSIEAEACVVIGDSLNDADLFEAFHHGLCPANSHPKIKALCQKLGFDISPQHYGQAILEFYSKI